MKIGVLTDCFGKGYHKGAELAAQAGAEGIQLYAVSGETAPENLNVSARKQVLQHARDLSLTISAICADMGGGGFAVPSQNSERIARTKKMIDLALDLDCRIITTHVGVVPDTQTHPRFPILRDAMGEIGLYAQKAGAYLAIETGPELSQTLLTLLEAVHLPSIGVNMDPANLVMTVNENSTMAVHTLKGYILHTHVKDGICLKPCEPEIMYAMRPAPSDYHEENYCIEVPPGEGDVDFPAYLAALREVGYDGYLTIERETGANPEAAIRKAIDFIRSLLPKE